MPAFTHPSRAHIVPVDKVQKRKKKVKPANITGKARPKLHKVNPIKRRIRDLERLLANKVDIPADVRIAQERELATLKTDLEVEETEIKRQEMIGRYHMVRFFESKKAERALKKARRELSSATTPNKTTQAKQKVHNCEVDYNYTRYFPFLKPYHALYPRRQGQIVGKEDEEEGEKEPEKEPEANADDETDRVMKGDLEIWKHVEKAMAEGTLDALRDGVPEQGKRGRSEEEVAEEPSSKKRSKNGRTEVITHRQKTEEQRKKEADDGDESDGGFFE